MSDDLFLKSGATFSPCRTWRYALWRIWDTGHLSHGNLMWIGLNPSTADEKADDPTVRRCMRFAQDWGYGGIFMLNLFAFRATDPKVMMAADDPIGPENDRILQEYHEAAGMTMAAWGVHGAFGDRDICVSRLRRVSPWAKTRYLGDDLFCLAKTVGGHPRHPLYVLGSTGPKRFHVRPLGSGSIATPAGYRAFRK